MKQEFVQEGMRTYLKIEGDDLENVGDKMFSYQTIPGFVPMEIEWVDEKKQYVYDVTGKLNLKQYLEKDGIGKHKVKKVMECLLSLPERLESYLLDGNDVRILPDCIFVDKHSEEVYGIYYPGNDCYGMTAYAAVAEFIIDHMNQKDTELAFFVYGLHKRFLEEGMTLVALREYMDSDSHVETDFVKEEEKKDSLIYQAKTTPDKEFLPFKKGQMDTEVLRHAVPIGVLILGVLVPVVLYAGGWFRLAVSGGTDWVKAAGAFIFFLGVSVYGAWKLWPQKEIVASWDETDLLSVCLIPCQGKEEPVPLSHFPFLIGSERERVDGVLCAKGVSAIHAQFYRFTSPKSKEYPYMIEIFSRNPDFIILEDDAVLTPLPIDDEISSLSAILLNEAYYELLKTGQMMVDGIPVLSPTCLIPFKAKAWLDLKERKLNGEQVDSKNIKKHKNDVFRLAQLITANTRQVLSSEIAEDMKKFLSEIADETVDLKSLGIRGTDKQKIIDMLYLCYNLNDNT